MKLFEVYYYSSCGTYFSAYLKSVTVFAENEEQAKEKALAWCNKNDYSFITKDKTKLGVRELVSDKFGVVDFNCSSDY